MKAKKMLRRSESITYAMPSDWFTYRNYFVKKTDPFNNDSNVKFGDGVFAQTFVGGYTWRFTGNLASAESREALTGKVAGKETQEEMPTRLQPYRTAKGKKAAKGAPAKQRRLKRVQQRSMVSREASQETPEVPACQPLRITSQNYKTRPKVFDQIYILIYPQASTPTTYHSLQRISSWRPPRSLVHIHDAPSHRHHRHCLYPHPRLLRAQRTRSKAAKRACRRRERRDGY